MARDSKTARVLELHKKGISSPAIAERLGMGIRHVYVIIGQDKAKQKDK